MALAKTLMDSLRNEYSYSEDGWKKLDWQYWTTLKGYIRSLFKQASPEQRKELNNFIKEIERREKLSEEPPMTEEEEYMAARSAHNSVRVLEMLGIGSDESTKEESENN